MSDSWQQPWSDNPNAPDIPIWVHFGEKVYLAGVTISVILYGIVVALFFQCMSALLSPVGRTKNSVKWGLVVHTVVMFSSVTVNTSMAMAVQSISFVDTRGFPGVGELPPGPYGYQFLIASKPLQVVPTFMFLLNQFLVDGLLLYRCCVIYAMNYWAITLPCLMYLASFVTGIMFAYFQISQPNTLRWESRVASNSICAYFAISLFLNVVLTLMIVGRLFLHCRNVRNALGTPAGAVGLYKAVVTMLIESCAIYGVSCVLFIGSWRADSLITDIFYPILIETQVIAPFLIVLRVAQKRALTSNVTSGAASSIRFRSQGEFVNDNEVPSVGLPTDSMNVPRETPDEEGVVVENIVGEVSLR